MLPDIITSLLKTLLYSAFTLITLLCLPFFIAHVADTWDAPTYPHSGFTPDCPTWLAPENSLPPTYNP